MPESSSTRGRRSAFDIVLAIGGLTLFLALVYAVTMGEDLSLVTPPLLGVAGVILLWPIREHRPIRALLLAGAFLILFWFGVQLTWVFLPFVVVYLLAYLFDPIVSYLHQRVRVPRWVSTLLVTSLVISVITLFILLLIPNIINQLETLGTRLLASMTDLQGWLATAPWLDMLEEADLVDKERFIAQFTTTVQEQVGNLMGGLPTASEEVLRSIGSLFEVVIMVAITPVLLFYTLKDYPYLKDQLIQLFPTFGGRRDYLLHASGIMGRYLRGQLTISAIAAVNVTVALLVFDVPFALLIGLLGGVLNMIPNLGIIITNLVGVLLAIIFGDPWLVKAFIVVVVLGGQSVLEQSVLTPNILGYHVGLHPVLIMLSLFIFGFFMGILGLVIAVPVTALLATAYNTFRSELTLELSTRSFQTASAGPAATPPAPTAPAPASGSQGDGAGGTDAADVQSPDAPSTTR